VLFFPLNEHHQQRSSSSSSTTPVYYLKTRISTMADVETTKVEEETTTTIKEVSKEVAAGEPVVTSDDKPEAPVVPEPAEDAKEGENGTAAEEQNGSANGNGSTNGVESAETTEEADGNNIEEVRKRKSEGVVDVADATDGVSAEKKAKLEEKSEEDGIEAPANGEAEVTA
jgi:hypothetical protein